MPRKIRFHSHRDRHGVRLRFLACKPAEPPRRGRSRHHLLRRRHRHRRRRAARRRGGRRPGRQDRRRRHASRCRERLLRARDGERSISPARTLLPSFIDPHSHYFSSLSVANQVNVFAPPAGPGKDIPAIVEELRKFRDARALPGTSSSWPTAMTTTSCRAASASPARTSTRSSPTTRSWSAMCRCTAPCSTRRRSRSTASPPRRRRPPGGIIVRKRARTSRPGW